MYIFLKRKRVAINQKGASAVIVAILLTTLIGLSALVVDLGYLYAERNRLQNVADASALSAARELYSEDGTSINTNAYITQKALEVADANHMETDGWDVTKGHYSFMGLVGGSRGFTADELDQTVPLDLWNFTEKQLDQNPAFINSVQVSASLNAQSFFSKIWNYTGFQLSVDSVAYLGFAGTIDIGEVDYPIGICEESVTKDDKVNCNIGRMSTSSGKVGDSNTAAWTDLAQPCSPSASTPEIRNLLEPCGSGNKMPLDFGETVGVSGGVDSAVFGPNNKQSIMNCWLNATIVKDGVENPIDGDDTDESPEFPWPMKLLVIDCCDGDGCVPKNADTCSRITGLISVEVLWILEKDDKDYVDAPYKMWNKSINDFWTNNSTDGKTRWDDFVSTFKIMSPDGLNPAEYIKKTIYFAPTCEKQEPTGGTGGKNYGIMSKIPVLVE